MTTNATLTPFKYAILDCLAGGLLLFDDGLIGRDELMSMKRAGWITNDDTSKDGSVWRITEAGLEAWKAGLSA